MVMLMVIYGFFLLIWSVIVILYYMWTSLFWSLILRAQKLENEGKLFISRFVSLLSVILNIFLLKIICDYTDTPSLFHVTKITSACFTAALIYIVVLGIATIPFIRKDGTDMLKQAIYGKKKKKKW